MPSTCTKDPVMYVLYHSNRDFIECLIRQCIANITAQHSSDDLRAELHVLTPAPDEPMASLRLRFFLLLNIDEGMRADLVNKDLGSFIPRLDAGKACRFYDDLADRLVPEWMKNESVTIQDAVDSITEAYLVS